MKKWKISDFVLIGLLAAIDAAVIYGVGREINKWVEMGVTEEEMYGYIRYLTGGFAVIGVVSAILCGIVGVYVGKLILKRHFKNMD